MADNQWYVGQEVALLSNGRLESILRVERVTPSGLPVARGTVWRVDGGERGRSHSWCSLRIRPITDADRAEMERRALARRAVEAANAARGDLTAEQARAILAVLGVGS